LGKHKSRMHLLYLSHAWKPLLPCTTIWNTWVFMYHQRFSYVWNFGCIHFMFFLNAWFLPNMLMLKSSHFKASCFGSSKWNFFIRQSTCGLCKTTQNDPMMMGFLGMKWHWRQFC
jgi:hypothetical protein